MLLPLGLLLARNGIVPSPLAVNGVGLVLVILPASLWATWWEAASKGAATPGKRLLRLRVLHEQARALPSARQSAVRDMIKIALPWELGHTVALGLREHGTWRGAGLVVDAHRSHLWLAAGQSGAVDHPFSQAGA